MAISFPASPIVGQTYAYNSRTWTWNGSLWNKITTSLTTSMLVDGSITTAKIADLAVTSPKLATAVTNSIAAGGGIKITSIVITDSSYTNLDDTALDTAGGYIKIVGTGFVSGCQVVINQTLATSTTFVSSTEIRAQLPATTAGTYIVYVANTDGSVGIRINGITFSATPTWTTSSSLPSSALSSAVSIQLVATSATSYVLTSGSTLPTGLTLSSGGLLSGTVTGLAAETTYSFSITATDAELQDSPRTFSITIIVGDPYFSYTTLLLSGNGTNNAQNNTFVDSSTNNFAITRTGTPTQGTFSPYGTNWSNVFNASTDKLTLTGPNLSSYTNFTFECWVNFNGFGADTKYFTGGVAGGYYQLVHDSSAGISLRVTGYTSVVGESSNAGWAIGTWYHVALVKNGSTYTIYKNGVSIATSTYTSALPSVTIGHIGGYDSTTGLNAYMSNARITNTAVYTAAFTPPTAPLTAITNTLLLTSQSNRFVDNSASPYTLTVLGTPSIQAFSPFASVGAYSAATNGGSIYFSGTSTASIETMLTIPASASFNFLASASFTIEGWINPKQIQNYSRILCINSTYTTNAVGININTDGKLVFYSYNVANPLLQSNSTIPFNTWTHIAICRSGTTFTMFINGIAQTSTYTSASALFNNSNPYITIGCGDANVGGFSPFTGYISNIRIMTSAVYTANFTPPTAPLTAVANTSLLLSGTNAGIIDSTAKNLITTVGDAKISTTQSKFGGSSMYFDGTGDYLTIPNSINHQFGTGNFTIEMWVYTNNLAAYQTLLDARSADSASSYGLFISNTGNIYWYDASGMQTSSNAISSNTWTHIAAVRTSGVLKLFIGGTQGYSAANTNAQNPTGIFTIGKNLASSALYIGYIDDLRITKGYARYTANFTPPVSQSQGQ